MILLEVDGFEVLVDILKYLIPSIIIFFTCYFVMRQFFEEDYRQKMLSIKEKNLGTLTPIKLQAYERLIIYLERISPDNLVLMLSNNTQSAKELQSLIINQVNEEYKHNIAQQIYVSDQCWEIIKIMKEQVLQLVDLCYNTLPNNSKGTDLGKAILHELMQKKEPLNKLGIDFIKKEVSIVI